MVKSVETNACLLLFVFKVFNLYYSMPFHPIFKKIKKSRNDNRVVLCISDEQAVLKFGQSCGWPSNIKQNTQT